MSLDIKEIQDDLRAAKLDGWLFYDFRGRDPIAQGILHLPPGMRTRRWYYFVPAKGIPRKLVHKIETESLAALPGDTLFYAGQEELTKESRQTVGACKENRNAVFAEERHSVRSDGGCRDRRAWCAAPARKS